MGEYTESVRWHGKYVPIEKAMANIPISNLARLRLDRRLTQRQVAQLVGIAPTTLSQIENLHRAPWPKLRRDLATVFGVEEEELFPSSG